MCPKRPRCHLRTSGEKPGRGGSEQDLPEREDHRPRHVSPPFGLVPVQERGRSDSQAHPGDKERHRQVHERECRAAFGAATQRLTAETAAMAAGSGSRPQRLNWGSRRDAQGIEARQTRDRRRVVARRCGLQNQAMAAILSRPSAFVPVAMSLAALALIAAQIATAGLGRQPDEGMAAHVWQLLMAAQLPLILYFAITWLPRAPRQASAVLGVQLLAFLAAVAPVAILRW
jgi:hypothetical protein